VPVEAVTEDNVSTPDLSQMASVGDDPREGLPSTGVACADRRAERERMVATQIEARGIDDPLVLHAMRRVPREAFVPAGQAEVAYHDAPIPIGEGQTMSEPYMVALMIASLRLRPTDSVLEIGTGSGYQAAILSTIAANVYTVEQVGSLADSARRRLPQLGYGRISVLEGDGRLGWRAHAPYDAIVVTASGPLVPAPLLEQMKIDGRLIMPVRKVLGSQRLRLVKRTGEDDWEFEDLQDVAFAPLIGAEESSGETVSDCS
jgi:protein-L-isoaspartate(D-aspartate) O-methyltransferase